MEKKKLIKIPVPCLIVVVIIGIYLFKNPPSPSQAPEDTAFALAVTEAIDFEALAEHGQPIIVDYSSDSCILCQQMKRPLSPATSWPKRLRLSHTAHGKPGNTSSPYIKAD